MLLVTEDIEAVINLMMDHETIMTDLKVEDKVKAITALIVQKNSGASRADKESLQDKVKELKVSIVGYQVDAIGHFKKLL